MSTTKTKTELLKAANTVRTEKGDGQNTADRVGELFEDIINYASDTADAVTSNATAITNEATARTTADSTLQGNIDTEATSRATADTALQTELLKRIKGISDASNGYTDPFINGGTYEDTDTMLAAIAAHPLQTESDSSKYAGNVRYDMQGVIYEVHNHPIHYDTSEWVQSISGPLALKSDGSLACGGHVYATFYRYHNSDGWTSWQKIEATDSTTAAALTTETSERKAADTTLSTSISTETTNRKTADTAEATARAAADTTLQNNIDAEATARATAVTAEASARQTADTTLQQNIDAVEKQVTRLRRDLAQYKEESISLTAGQAGKYIDSTGTVKTDSSYTISAIVAGKKGMKYEVKPSATLRTDLALVAMYTTEPTKVQIQYTETNDSDGNVLTATADYDSTVKYTYNYEEDSEGNKTLKNITDKDGNVVDFIPQYRTVEAGQYVPLFKNLSTDAPEEGWFATTLNQDCSIVFSLPSADFPHTGIRTSYGFERSIITNKADELLAKELEQNISQLQKSLSTMSEQSLAVGFSRMNGSVDPAASADDCFGKKSYIHDIGTHLHLGVVKDGKVVRTAKAGRLTVGTDGAAIAIDGTEGDVMLYFDCPVELLKARAEVSGVDTNVVGLSLTKAAWQGNVSKTLDRFAVTPDETVNCSLDGDTRSQAHSVYNTSAIGTYSAKQTMFAETFRASGAGIPHHYVSGVTAIQQAQKKNADELTNRPYMGFYYEFYEAILALMFAECGTVYVNAPTMFGCGTTTTNNANASTFYDEIMTGNAGVKWLDADGNAAYTGLMTPVLVGETKTYPLAGLVGTCYYTCAEMLEPQRILDAIAAAGLVDNIGNSSAIFSYDDEGTMTVTTDGSINPATGEGMTANKKYFVVRNVPNCEGMADGVMTAVINVYFLMNTDESNTVCISTTDTTPRTQAIFKFSFPIYRGFTLPLCGAFRQMQGAHYLYGKDADGNVIHKFVCASNVDNIPAATSFTKDDYYNTIETTLNFARGLDIIADREGLTGSAWQKSADYSHSLFDATVQGGGLSSYESMFRYLRACYGVGTNGVPDNGYWSLNASAVGCYAFNGRGSVRTLVGDCALSYGYDNFAGAFAIPHLAMA